MYRIPQLRPGLCPILVAVLSLRVSVPVIILFPLSITLRYCARRFFPGRNARECPEKAAPARSRPRARARADILLFFRLSSPRRQRTRHRKLCHPRDSGERRGTAGRFIIGLSSPFLRSYGKTDYYWPPTPPPSPPPPNVSAQSVCCTVPLMHYTHCAPGGEWPTNEKLRDVIKKKRG